ncbi:MAG: Positive regulator of CheA protein activity (CheW) [Candidatus Ozemobacter sibiricus]|jgi:purine-binding chemotaxis protein CheW|uniref:Positive regulator of CheA protein activity (CheW) n=1 Tax=Candidatus Ozemobacter sibiricus TaxID=2268124 RepID=A0A367ZSZ8_9BACT|nr:MAG: Positive regulator of CheA protein activity (CheW) [Candidatus Ozemobacter sibiricus]
MRSSVEATPSPADAGRPASLQFLTIQLDHEVFVLEVARVREILDFPPITKIPRTPDFLRGVVNIRGSVVPVVDLKQKFGLGQTEKTINTCIVVVEVTLEGETAVVGVLADACHDVIEVESNRIEPPPKLGTRLNIQFLKGVVKLGETFGLYLDLDRLFSPEELALVLEETDGQPTAR